MRRFVSVLFCSALLLAASACGTDGETDPAQAPETNQEARSSMSYETDPVPAPDVSMKTLDGNQINLAEQQGKVILVNFWATWCAPCRKEIPDLIELYSDLKDDGLEIVGIAVDQEGAEVVEPFVKKHEVNYPIVLDPEQSLESHFDAMYGLPTTYVVNPDGQVVQRVTGLFPVQDMKSELETMLAGEDDAAAT